MKAMKHYIRHQAELEAEEFEKRQSEEKAKYDAMSDEEKAEYNRQKAKKDRQLYQLFGVLGALGTRGYGFQYDRKENEK